MTTGFQSDAFQNNAFQIDVASGINQSLAFVTDDVTFSVTQNVVSNSLPYTMGGGLIWRNTKHDKRKYEEELKEAIEAVEKIVYKKVDKQALISFFNAKYKQEIKQALVTRLDTVSIEKQKAQKQAIQRRQQELLIRQRALEREYEDEDEILMLLAA